MDHLADFLVLVGGPVVFFCTYGVLRLLRGARVVHLEEPELQVVMALAAMDALGRGDAEVSLRHFADALLTSRYVEAPTTPPDMRPADPGAQTAPTWSQELLRLLGVAARDREQGSMLGATLLALQRSDDPEIARALAQARAHDQPQIPPEVGDPAVILHNDDTTTMDAVVDLLMKYAGHDRRQATYVMLVVHHRGQAPIADRRRDITRPLADALELGAFELHMRRIRISLASPTA